MSFETNLKNFATRIATEFKALRVLINTTAGDLSGLTTTQKANLVSSINELDGAIKALAAGSGAISDGTTSTSTTWSSTKTASAIAALIAADTATNSTATTFSVTKILALIEAAKTQVKNDLTNGASTALDTLKELSDALGGDANFATTVNTALGNRVRFDAAQTLTTAQKLQACQNIGLGDPEVDLVATFNAGLVA